MKVGSPLESGCEREDYMEFWYAIGGILLLVLFLLMLAPSRHLYRCQKCGFETYSEAEASGHEKLENAHKVL
jgi:hypothetical protein